MKCLKSKAISAYTHKLNSPGRIIFVLDWICKFIAGERTLRGVGPLIGKQGARSRAHMDRLPANVGAVPLQLLGVYHLRRDIRDANAGEWVTFDPLQPCRHCHILCVHIEIVDPADFGECVRVVVLVGVLSVVSSHPEDPLHGMEAHPPHKDVLHEPSPPDACLDPDTRFWVDGRDVLRDNVTDSARHLAPDGNDGAGGWDASQPLDDDALARPVKGNPILVPATLYGDTVVARHDEWVLDVDVGGRVWNQNFAARLEE